VSAIRPDHDEIIARYRRVAALPDGLFLFTFPLRRGAIDRLHLAPGSAVLEVGCGSGANFAFLVRAVGPTGHVVGVDLSPEMVAAARARVKRGGWSNVQVVESPAESMRLADSFDGLLLFAMHDVLTSPEAIARCLEHVRPGGRVVVVSPALADRLPGRLLNPLAAMAFRRFSVSQADLAQPWRLLAKQLPGLRVERLGPGILFLATGRVG
jgi:demethylmenaquinone methyltransferase/2-methoxy-6-polyprenyl-1,4-benzoquinol methylase